MILFYLSLCLNGERNVSLFFPTLFSPVQLQNLPWCLCTVSAKILFILHKEMWFLQCSLEGLSCYCWKLDSKYSKAVCSEKLRLWDIRSVDPAPVTQMMCWVPGAEQRGIIFSKVTLSKQKQILKKLQFHVGCFHIIYWMSMQWKYHQSAELSIVLGLIPLVLVLHHWVTSWVR